MEIKVNGKVTTFAEGKSLLEFLQHRGHNPDTVVVEYNCQVVPRGTWDSIIIHENDTIEVLQFVGGG